MNSIDTRFDATIGIGNIGVENRQIDSCDGERTAEIRLENLEVLRRC